MSIKSTHENSSSEEQIFRRLYEEAPLPYQSLNAEAKLLFVNEAWEKALGYKREEVIGKSVCEFHLPGQMDKFEQGHQRFLSEGLINGIEVDFICKNGDVKTMLVNGRIAKDENDNFERTHCILTDITELHIADHLLKESELRLRQITENIQDVFWMTDSKTNKTIYINPAFESIWGASREKLYENPRLFVDYVHPDDKDRVNKCIDNLSKGIYFDIEYRIITPEGGMRLIHDRSFPVRNDEGDVYRVAGIAQDITEFHAVSEKLNKSEILFSTVFNNSSAGMVIATADGHILSVNNTFSEMLGFKPDELAGMRIEDISHPDDWHINQKVISEVKQGKRNKYQFEKRYLRKDGSYIWGLLSSSWISDEPSGSGFFIALVQNIEEKKRAEFLLKKELLERDAILNAAPIGIGLVKNRFFDWVSQSFLDMLGYSESDLIHKNARMIYPTLEEYERVGREKYAQIEKTGTGEIETCMVRKDGSTIDVLLSFSVLDMDNAGSGHIFTVLDITQRKKIQNELVQKHIEFTTLLNSFPSPICIKDSDLRYQLVNKAFLEFTGLSEEQVIGQSEIDIFRCESGVDTLDLDFEILSKREQFIDSSQCLSNALGELRYFNTTKTPIVNEENNVTGMVCISTDITEVKKLPKNVWLKNWHCEIR